MVVAACKDLLAVNCLVSISIEDMVLTDIMISCNRLQILSTAITFKSKSLTDILSSTYSNLAHSCIHINSLAYHPPCYSLITIELLYPSLWSTLSTATSEVSRLPHNLSYTPGKPHTITFISSEGGNPCFRIFSSLTCSHR